MVVHLNEVRQRGELLLASLGEQCLHGWVAFHDVRYEVVEEVWALPVFVHHDPGERRVHEGAGSSGGVLLGSSVHEGRYGRASTALRLARSQ